MRLIILACLACLAAAAFAAEGDADANAPPPKPRPSPVKRDVLILVKRYDLDKDGRLSKDEIAAIEDERDRNAVLTLDKNEDHEVDADEIRALRRASERQKREAAAAQPHEDK